MKMSALLPPKAIAGLVLTAGLVLAPGLVLAQDADDDITRDLNSGPPAAIAAPSAAQPEPDAEPEIETAPATQPGVEPVEAAEPAGTSAPEPAALTVSERLALPFRVAMPEGAGLYPGRSGPEFDIFSVRRDGRGLVMIYVGPQSQFPIYSGEQRERAGRRSIIVSEGGRSLALEHLFRLGDGLELHVWVSAVSDEDRALADAIGQTVEPR
jgi:hypothetical protein